MSEHFSNRFLLSPAINSVPSFPLSDVLFCHLSLVIFLLHWKNVVDRQLPSNLIRIELPSSPVTPFFFFLLEKTFISGPSFGSCSHPCLRPSVPVFPSLYLLFHSTFDHIPNSAVLGIPLAPRSSPPLPPMAPSNPNAIHCNPTQSDQKPGGGREGRGGKLQRSFFVRSNRTIQ